MTLRLKWLQKGTFDTRGGEYEFYLKRHDMEKSRRRFLLSSGKPKCESDKLGGPVSLFRYRCTKYSILIILDVSVVNMQVQKKKFKRDSHQNNNKQKKQVQ
uniref:Uncharacterized protein n=1 Tax=Globodera pallida TaxID=36090 RepID=A0A183BT06_GLOPA